MGGDDRILFGFSSGGNNTLNNTATGTLNLSSTAAGPVGLFTGTATVNNAGTLNQTAAGAHAFEGVPFNNTGTVNVDAGTLRANGGGTNSGLYALDAGTTLEFSGGTHNVNGGTTITGPGSLLVSAGTVNLATGVSATLPAITISGGTFNFNNTAPITIPSLAMSGSSSPTLGGTGNVTVTGAFDVTGSNATLAGTGTFTTPGNHDDQRSRHHNLFHSGWRQDLEQRRRADGGWRRPHPARLQYRRQQHPEQHRHRHP